MSAHCCDSKQFDGTSKEFRRALLAVTVINFAMFVVEIVAGHVSNSKSLQTDALDFFADAVTYTISFAVIGMSLRVRSFAALGKGISLLLMGLWVLGTTIYQVLYMQIPQAEVMGIIGAMALAANVISVLILMRWKDGDANVRSVWLCSRNDAIGNVAVMLAALGVFGTGSGWPDLVVAFLMAALFINSAIKIIRQSRHELEKPEEGFTPRK
jgi:cation diffusion facilitator family transporter